MSSTKPKPVYQLRRQSLLHQQAAAVNHPHLHLEKIIPAATAAAVVTHIPSVDEVTHLCKDMMHFNHLSKEIFVPKGQDADADEVDAEVADKQQSKKTPSSSRPLRRRSNSFDKLIKAFRLQDELDDDDSQELKDEAGKSKEDSQKFEPVHVPPPNKHSHRHHKHHHDKQDEAKGHHLHEAMLLSLIAKSVKSNENTSQANTQHPPASASAAASFRNSNPFDSGDVFDKLHASSSSMDSLCLDDLCAMAKMDAIQRDTEREIRAHLDQERREHHRGSTAAIRGHDEHEAAVLRATLQAYAAHSSSMTSCAIESISLTEFDGLIMPKSEVPIDVSSEHRRLWRPHKPSLHRKISATTA